MKKCSVLMAVVAAGMLVASASATIMVDFDPFDAYIPGVGDTIQINIIADIPESEAIVGWGMDAVVDDPAIADITGVTVNGALFDPVTTPDGDGLGGLVPLGGNVWGNGVILATLDVTGFAEGWTSIFSWDDNPSDLTEGFAIDPALGGGFADVNYLTGFVTVLPEPASLTLLALAGLLAVRRR